MQVLCAPNALRSRAGCDTLALLFPSTFTLKKSLVMPAASPDNMDDWSSQLETLRALAQVVRDEKLSELEVESDGLLITLKSPAAIPQPSFSTASNASSFEYSIEDFVEETLAAPLAGNYNSGGFHRHQSRVADGRLVLSRAQAPTTRTLSKSATALKSGKR
jgi:hypothetical protein